MCPFIASLSQSRDRKVTVNAPVQPRFIDDPNVKLMLRIQDGDDEAFNQLVAKFQDRLIRWIFRHVNDWQTAEDISQEVFIRVYRSRHRYRPTASLTTWLFRIARNLTSNACRDRFRRREYPVSDGSPESSTDESPVLDLPDKPEYCPTRQLAFQELDSAVDSTVASLNDRQQKAISLTRHQGMSYSEIGAAMHLTATSVKGLLSRARKHLRAKLEPYLSSGRTAA